MTFSSYGFGTGCRRAVAVAALACVALLGIRSAAYAVAGVGVGAAPIEAAHPVAPASSVVLPSLYLVNTGTVESTYGVRLTKIGGGRGRSVPEAWLSISPARVALKSKAATWVKLRLNVPSGAPQGSYSSYLVAGTTAGGGGSGTSARFGGQAATEIRFTVDPSQAGPPLTSKAAGASNRSTGLQLGPWWAWVSGFSLVALVVAWRKSRIRIRITRT